MTARGRFITLEGGEGVGKSTQVGRLAEALLARGLDVVTTREPGGTLGAEAIRGLLMTGDTDRWSARTESLLFAAARADHVQRVIRPALEAGQWVICDRYLDSTRAYQGAAGGIADDDILALHAVGSEGLMPDRTLFLDFPPEIGVERTYGRDLLSPDRMGSHKIEFYQSVDDGFRRIASNEPDRVRTVDASGSIDKVSERLLAALSDLL